jgi:hypothetical protein
VLNKIVLASCRKVRAEFKPGANMRISSLRRRRLGARWDWGAMGIAPGQISPSPVLC